jgi:phenylacetate-coenzyme A ligase PaaK-like adenylate-forming protein
MTTSDIKKIIRNWPAYSKFIENKGINPKTIKNLSELPVIDKQFLSSAIHMIPLFRVRNIIPSSGSTGDDFSFGLFGDTDMKKASCTIDMILKNRFHTGYKKTLLINMLPGAITLHSSSVSVASIGVRTDTAISVIKSFGSCFDQLLLVGEPLFMKNLLERGVKESIPWEHIPLYIIIGGEWTPLGYGDYLEKIAGPQRVFSFMGMAELGLCYFYETDETIILRRTLSEDRLLARALFGETDFCPMLFEYDENEIYVESLNDPCEPFGSLILTTADPNRALPLIRYRGGDKGKILSRDEINHALKSFGYSPIFGQCGSHILAHFGRGKNVSRIYPEKIKETIFSNEELASTTTGNFRLCTEKNVLYLKIQMKEDIYPAFSLEKLYEHAFAELPVATRLYPYKDFPHLLDFERKIRYVCEDNTGKGSRREKPGIPLAV